MSINYEDNDIAETSYLLKEYNKTENCTRNVFIEFLIKIKNLILLDMLFLFFLFALNWVVYFTVIYYENYKHDLHFPISNYVILKYHGIA
ncbi:hypothetical protein HZS_6501 [Henneguya salminicola]|nr:hypothetical protein HZS_6501 [Henneguya salminicola]